ncbi:MAG TPA: VWA domain-containing protein [Longimicrobiales bacterium]|nr:VWA domain-containing protein [Longimicrobiales bacterium]
MSESRFLENLVDFGRTLRSVGMPCTPLRISELARALTWVGIEDRAVVFRTARALLVHRREDLALFETVFNRFWRSPEAHRGASGRTTRRLRQPTSSGRFTIATYAAFRARQEMEERDVADRSGTASDEELLRRKRFAEMSDEELEAAQRIISRMRWDVSLRTTRRRSPAPSRGEIDLRRVLRETSRLGAVSPRLPRRQRTEKRRPLVLIADVSGSMERYARLLLHFLHTAVREIPDVEAFVFGTRLSRITEDLRLRNVDRALDEAASRIVDWGGGTRIGACLADFNRQWGRRVLRRGAVVVLASDGCERGTPELLALEMRRLQGRCHRLVWVNPHAGHERYAPKVAGTRAALPFADDFLPLGDLRSVEQLADALARLRRSGPRGLPARDAGPPRASRARARRKAGVHRSHRRKTTR